MAESEGELKSLLMKVKEDKQEVKMASLVAQIVKNLPAMQETQV